MKRITLEFDQYNDKIQQEDTEHYESRRLKASHLNTMRYLVNCQAQYFIFQKKFFSRNIDSLKESDLKQGIWMSNGLLAKKLKYCSMTGYRHIIRLSEAGFIVDKLFRGSNSAYEITLNPDLLIPDRESAQKELLTSFPDTFKSCPLGVQFTFCYNIVTGT